MNLAGGRAFPIGPDHRRLSSSNVVRGAYEH